MDNEVDKESAGVYVDALNGEHIPADAYFCAGVCLSVLLPEFALATYGLLPPAVFALTAAAGAVWGIVKYRSAYRPLSCVVVGADERVPTRGGATLEWVQC